jgi:hypothetical protein
MSEIDWHNGDQAVLYLRTTDAIRERCEQLFSLAQKNELEHFALHLDRLEEVVRATCEEIKANYPDLEVPLHSRWRHFGAGDVDRESILNRRLSLLTPRARCRAKIELAIVSVLLDAGAGNSWRYTEAPDAATYSRSEGLAVASFHSFASGVFGGAAYTVSGATLNALTSERLAEAFQVSESNPLLGLEGRTALLNRLGAVIEAQKDDFQGLEGRLGGLLESIEAAGQSGQVQAGKLLTLVLTVFASIWPGRIIVDHHNLGDVWKHSKITGPGLTSGLIPFHKLSQWLTYSLLEPLKEGGITVTHLDQLTGLAEYRNGGLFIDGGVIALRDPQLAAQSHHPSSELIVEWRALTVALLDRLARGVRETFGMSEEELSLGSILQGGTWSLGRKLAAERRPQAAPPLVIKSDGTIF